MSVISEYPEAYSNGKLTVHIHKDVIAIWHENKQYNHSDHEKFGVLIGSKSEYLDEYWIESVTSPFTNDESSTHSFLLKDAQHQKKVDLMHESSNGECIYLGTWHTHPELIPVPSNVDIKDWKRCVKQNKSRALFFFIVGMKETKIYFQIKESIFSTIKLLREV